VRGQLFAKNVIIWYNISIERKKEEIDMSIFDNRRSGENNKPETKPANTGEQFKRGLQDAANRNLSPEQLKARFLEETGIPDDILRIPGVKDTLFRIGCFEMYEFGGDFKEDDAKKASETFKFEDTRSKNGKIIIRYAQFESDLGEKATIEITQSGDTHKIHMEHENGAFDNTEDREYEDKIEKYRKFYHRSTSGDFFKTEEWLRDKNDLAKVYYTMKAPTRDYTILDKNVFKLTTLEHTTDISRIKGVDIASLELTDRQTINNQYDIYESQENRRSRVMRRISESKYSAECRAFMGVEEPSLSYEPYDI
jgi:hypothetical protein